AAVGAAAVGAAPAGLAADGAPGAAVAGLAPAGAVVFSAGFCVWAKASEPPERNTRVRTPQWALVMIVPPCVVCFWATQDTSKRRREQGPAARVSRASPGANA